jgi:hypothetical protein
MVVQSTVKADGWTLAAPPATDGRSKPIDDEYGHADRGHGESGEPAPTSQLR